MTPTDRARLGAAGEAHARRWLEARGFAFVAANWRCASGELDLVMAQGGELVVVEVKLRRGEARGRAEDAITPAKARKLLDASAWFVADHPDWHDAIWRIDLVAITLDAAGRLARIEHVENAVAAG